MKHIILVFALVFANLLANAQTQEPEIPQVDFQEMMKQMEEMMQSFPADSIYFKGMDDMKEQLGSIDFDAMGGHLDVIMQKMQEMFSDIDFSEVEKEFKKMEEEMKKKNPENNEDVPQKSEPSTKKKRKVTRL